MTSMNYIWKYLLLNVLYCKKKKTLLGNLSSILCIQNSSWTVKIPALFRIKTRKKKRKKLQRNSRDSRWWKSWIKVSLIKVIKLTNKHLNPNFFFLKTFLCYGTFPQIRFHFVNHFYKSEKDLSGNSCTFALSCVPEWQLWSLRLFAPH